MANSLLATDSSHGASVDLSSSKSRHQASKFVRYYFRKRESKKLPYGGGS
ncbi:hypothetical protein OOU_Y34scaffold00662g22 [Pyricularia oryzae Y34]|uniref:Uncharacterized protein n=2 Tax=Pyricularia oryzae TaxID=318829 RepID=A0AA97NU70_PYRO3|nr:hypothetical protein OOU_Y34scaffold00662g22 [Pyricularia oryzae Y34]